MKALASLLIFLLPISAAAGEAHLKGSVVGFRMDDGQDRCYVAIEDSSNAYYDSGYHHITNKAMCSMAKAAFLTGITVAAITNVELGATNSIKSMELVRVGATPYWPPYGRKRPK